jgi:hypothetical protein
MAERSILRASDADRERVAERLRHASTEGRLTAEELEERMHRALSARTYGELDGLVADLPRHIPALPATPKTSGLAIGSLVMGFLWMGGMGSLIALVLGLLARKEIADSNGRVTGRGLAFGGMLLGGLGVLVAALLVVLSVAGHLTGFHDHWVVVGPSH